MLLIGLEPCQNEGHHTPMMSKRNLKATEPYGYGRLCRISLLIAAVVTTISPKKDRRAPWVVFLRILPPGFSTTSLTPVWLAH